VQVAGNGLGDLTRAFRELRDLDRILFDAAVQLNYFSVYLLGCCPSPAHSTHILKRKSCFPTIRGTFQRGKWRGDPGGSGETQCGK
jgi:hypothetical protein